MAQAGKKLGELLVLDRVISGQQLSDAIRNQVVYGGRLGTNVVELGYASHDQIALSLAKQHGVPAALTKHLRQHDPALQKLLPKQVAAQCMAFPIARLRSAPNRIAVCFRDPVAAAVSRTAEAMSAEIIPSVAAEVTVMYWLRRCYGVVLPQRFSLSEAGEQAPMPRTTTEQMAAVDVNFDDDDSIEIDIEDPPTLSDEFQLVNLDDKDVVKDVDLYRPKRRTVQQLLDASKSSTNIDLAEAAQRAAELAAIAASGVSEFAQEPMLTLAPEPPAPPPTSTSRPEPLALDDALARINGADDRASVADAVLGYMAGPFSASVLMIVKADLALGYRGFGGAFDEDSVESIVVPLSVPTIFQAVQKDLKLFVGPPGEGAHAVQTRFFKLFPGEPPAQVVVAPVNVRGRLVCMLYGHPRPGTRIAMQVQTDLRALSKATEVAFVRLIYEAKTKSTT